MTENINWTLNVQVDGGPKILASDTIKIEAYDKFDVKIENDGNEKEVQLQPGDSGYVKFLMIKSDNYGDKLTYKVNATADVIKLDAMQVFIGAGAVGLLKEAPHKLVFLNGLESGGKKNNGFHTNPHREMCYKEGVLNMPTTPTYPGVYIEEIPSGVRTIIGVATSITAFIGRALRGPVEEPITINNYGDFERIFGGLWIKSMMSYAVRDFYLNGGSQAIIVRLYHTDNVNPDFAQLNANGLILEAAYPGEWGNYLRARVDHEVSEELAKDYGLEKTDLFNLTVRDTRTGATEQFRNVTIKESPAKVDRVLTDSRLVKVKTLPGAVPNYHGDPSEGKNIWNDDNASCKVDNLNKASDGKDIQKGDFIGPGKEMDKKGLYALLKADLFNLLCIPPYLSNGDIDTELAGEAAKYCEDHRAMLIVDPPSGWKSKENAKSGIGNIGTKSKNAALFFPRFIQPNPLRKSQMEEFAPCGAVAGIFARTDLQRGVWKAPAGQEAALVGVPQLSVPLTDAENGELNPLGINCIRSMPATGRVVWGSRTLQGDDRLASEWKYIPIRRLALYIEESLYRGTQWVVFEPNDEPLWAQIRLNLGAFMHNLFRQGAFQGMTPKDAYVVKCDRETTTQNDVDQGIVNILVGFAPLKPAEFVFIKIQQMAGQIKT